VRADVLIVRIVLMTATRFRIQMLKDGIGDSGFPRPRPPAMPMTSCFMEVDGADRRMRKKYRTDTSHGCEMQRVSSGVNSLRGHLRDCQRISYIGYSHDGVFSQKGKCRDMNTAETFLLMAVLTVLLVLAGTLPGGRGQPADGGENRTARGMAYGQGASR